MPNFYIDRSTPIQFESQSITKREYFAAMAMQVIIAANSGENTPLMPTELVARYSVSYADTLLSELDKTDSNE